MLSAPQKPPCLLPQLPLKWKSTVCYKTFAQMQMLTMTNRMNCGNILKIKAVKQSNKQRKNKVAQAYFRKTAAKLFSKVGYSPTVNCQDNLTYSRHTYILPTRNVESGTHPKVADLAYAAQYSAYPI